MIHFDKPTLFVLDESYLGYILPDSKHTFHSLAPKMGAIEITESNYRIANINDFENYEFDLTNLADDQYDYDPTRIPDISINVSCDIMEVFSDSMLKVIELGEQFQANSIEGKLNNSLCDLKLDIKHRTMTVGIFGEWNNDTGNMPATVKISILGDMHTVDLDMHPSDGLGGLDMIKFRSDLQAIIKRFNEIIETE